MRTATQALIVRFLENEGPMTSDELAELVGVTRRSINRALLILLEGRPATRRVHIHAWPCIDRGLYGSQPVPQYAAGPGRNAKKPEPKTVQQFNKEYWARQRTPERLLAKAARVTDEQIRAGRPSHGTILTASTR